MAMEYTEEQLNNFDKSTLIQLFLVQQSQARISMQNCNCYWNRSLY